MTTSKALLWVQQMPRDFKGLGSCSSGGMVVAGSRATFDPGCWRLRHFACDQGWIEYEVVDVEGLVRPAQSDQLCSVVLLAKRTLEGVMLWD